MGQQREQTVLDHLAAPGDAEDLVVARDARAIEPSAQPADHRRPGSRRRLFLRSSATQWRDRLERQARRAHPVIPADLDDESCDRRVQMDVLVAVDVVEPETGGAERLELRADFRGQFAARGGRKIKAKSGAHHVGVEGAIRANEGGHFARRQQRHAVRQHQMQPDAQFGQSLGALHRIRRGGGADHQARDGQHAVAMRLFDRLVHGDIAAEIVGADDKALFALSSRRKPGPTHQYLGRWNRGSRLSPG